MAVKYYAGDKIVGLSTDEKPLTVPDGATFIETNTKKHFIKTGGVWEEMVGEQGPQGEQGSQGSQGDEGSQGPQGNAGGQGPQGYQGSTGSQGPQGDEGSQGDIGSQGPQGNQGNQGSQGQQGEQGEIGSQGPQGTQGFQGNTGPQGQQGFQGFQGVQGATGEQGPQGNQGSQGNQGVPGGAMSWLGDWVLDYGYVVDDAVSNGTPKASFICIQAHTSSSTNEPDVGVDWELYWDYLADHGEQGPQGSQGNQGTQGQQGSQGTQGNAGVQGPQGEQGDVGEQGLQGPQGFQGNTGLQGPQGNQGFQGETGDTGPQGPQGNQGNQGNQGVQGDTGLQGPQGNQGTQGPQGFQGVAGGSMNWLNAWETAYGYIVDDAVYNGIPEASYICIQAHTSSSENEPDVGVNWETYWNYLANHGQQGSQGNQGNQGFQGSQGNTGLQGPQGEQGDIGNTGPQGPQGHQGFQGETGLQGPQGLQGFQGNTGSQGSQGNQGDVGEQGPQGNTGSQGNQGFQGVTGSQGPQGDAGENGVQGPQGFQGNQGLQGTQGNTGSQGAQGNTGAQGTQGVQGSQGTQGPQGAQGESGAGGTLDDAYTAGRTIGMDLGPITFDVNDNENGIFTFDIDIDVNSTEVVDQTGWTCDIPTSGNTIIENDGDPTAYADGTHYVKFTSGASSGKVFLITLVQNLGGGSYRITVDAAHGATTNDTFNIIHYTVPSFVNKIEWNENYVMSQKYENFTIVREDINIDFDLTTGFSGGELVTINYTYSDLDLSLTVGLPAPAPTGIITIYDLNVEVFGVSGYFINYKNYGATAFYVDFEGNVGAAGDIDATGDISAVGALNSGLGATLSGGQTSIYGGKLLTATPTTGYPSLNFPAGVAPSSPAEGDIWNSSAKKSLDTRIDGITQSIKGVLTTITSSTTVANTTTETTLMTGPTLPANFFVAGKTVHISAYGVYDTKADPCGTLDMKVKLGSTVILDTGAIAVSAGMRYRGWILEGYITCRTVGSSGTVMAQGTFTLAISTANGTYTDMENTAAITIDTTASQALTVTAQWQTANASNTITNSVGIVEVLN